MEGLGGANRLIVQSVNRSIPKNIHLQIIEPDGLLSVAVPEKDDHFIEGTIGNLRVEVNGLGDSGVGIALEANHIVFYFFTARRKTDNHLRHQPPFPFFGLGPERHRGAQPIRGGVVFVRKVQVDFRGELNFFAQSKGLPAADRPLCGNGDGVVFKTCL